jgi:type II secretory pathway pseudopilin PulG
MLALDAAVLVVLAAILAATAAQIAANPDAQEARARDLERLKRAIDKLFSNTGATGVNQCPIPISTVAQSSSSPTTTQDSQTDSVTPEEKEILDKLGPLEGLTPEEIKAKLKEQGFSGPAASDGSSQVYTKDAGNGRTIGVRLDPATPTGPDTAREIPQGKADEIPHSHKESVPTSEVKDGNYDQLAPGKRNLDDQGRVKIKSEHDYWKKTHIPMNGNP